MGMFNMLMLVHLLYGRETSSSGYDFTFWLLLKPINVINTPCVRESNLLSLMESYTILNRYRIRRKSIFENNDLRQ